MQEIIKPIPLRLERSRYEINEVFPHFESKHIEHIKNLLFVISEVNKSLLCHTLPDSTMHEVLREIRKIAQPHEEEAGVKLTTFTMQQIALDYLYYTKGGGESDEIPLSLSLRSRLMNGYYDSVYEDVPNLVMQGVGTLPVTYSGDIRDLLAPVAVTLVPTPNGLRTFIEIAEIQYPQTDEHAVISFSERKVVTINDKNVILPDELIDLWFRVEELEAERQKKKDQPKELIELKRRMRGLTIRVAEKLAKDISNKYKSVSIGRLPFDEEDILYDSTHSFLMCARRFQVRLCKSLFFHTLFHRVKAVIVTKL